MIHIPDRKKFEAKRAIRTEFYHEYKTHRNDSKLQVTGMNKPLLRTGGELKPTGKTHTHKTVLGKQRINTDTRIYK